MNPFHSHPSPLTPEVELDPARGTLRIVGECYPEDPTVFFGPILAAIASRAEPPPVDLDVSFRLTYVNSASAIWLRRILVALDALAGTGVCVHVTWEYDEDDDVTLELGHDLSYQLHRVLFLEAPVAS